MALIKRTSARFTPRLNEYTHRGQVIAERGSRVRVRKERKAAQGPVAPSKRERSR